MLGGQLHLRHTRQAHDSRLRRWRTPLIGGLLVVAIGAASFEPLAPTVLAPLGAPAVVMVPSLEPVAPVQPLVALPVVRAAPVAAPTLVTLPTAVPATPSR